MTAATTTVATTTAAAETTSYKNSSVLKKATKVQIWKKRRPFYFDIEKIVI